MQATKLPPYQRLKTILKGDDVIMTDKSIKNLNELLGVTQKENFWTKILRKIKSIDNLIFKKNSRVYSNKYHRRK